MFGEEIRKEDRQSIERLWSDVIVWLILQEPWNGEAGSMAVAKAGGKITMNWTTCQLLPNEIMESVVAHEMGHIYQYAIGKNRDNMTPEESFRDNKV